MTESIPVSAPSEADSRASREVGDASTTAVREPEPGGRSRRRVLAATAALFVLPAFICRAAGVDLFYRGNGIDPYIYVGVVERLRDYVARFPNLYYEYRFGFVLPEWAAERLLGQRAGYLTLRFALLGLVAVLLRGRNRRPASIAAAGLGATVILMSPILHRAIFTWYTESLAVCFLMLGAAVLVDVAADRPRQLVRALIGGVALGLAWNAQFAALVLSVIIAAVVLLDGARQARWRPLGAHVRLAVAVTAGSLAVVAAGVLVYGVVLGHWDVYTATLDLAKQPINPVYIDVHRTWFTWRHYLLVLPLSVVAGTIAGRRTDDAGERAALRRLVWIVALSTLAFSYLEWGRDGAILSVYYYSSYPLSLAVLLLGRAAAAMFRDAGRRTWQIVPAAAAVVVAYGWAGSLKPRYSVLLAVVVVVVAVAAFGVRLRRFVPLACLAVVVLAAYTTVSSPHDFPAATPQFRLDPRYDASLFVYDDSGAELYSLADDFARALPSLPHDRGEIRVWFDNDPASITNQVLSVLIHNTSALQSPADPPLPALTTFPRERLDTNRPRYLVLLDTSPDDVDQALTALTDAGEPYAIRWRKQFTRGRLAVTGVLLERDDNAWRDFPCPGAGGAATYC